MNTPSPMCASSSACTSMATQYRPPSVIPSVTQCLTQPQTLHDCSTLPLRTTAQVTSPPPTPTLCSNCDRPPTIRPTTAFTAVSQPAQQPFPVHHNPITPPPLPLHNSQHIEPGLSWPHPSSLSPGNPQQHIVWPTTTTTSLPTTTTSTPHSVCVCVWGPPCHWSTST